MKIIRRDKANVCTIDELSNGDVFELNLSNSEIFIKTENIVAKDGERYNALRQDNGQIVFICEGAQVRQLNAKLVIMPLPTGVDE